MGILGHIVASGQHVCMMSDTCVAKEQLSPVGHTAAKMSTAPANQLIFFFVVLGFMNRIFFFVLGFMDTLAEWSRRRPAKPMGSPRDCGHAPFRSWVQSRPIVFFCSCAT